MNYVQEVQSERGRRLDRMAVCEVKEMILEDWERTATVVRETVRTVFL